MQCKIQAVMMSTRLDEIPLQLLQKLLTPKPNKHLEQKGGDTRYASTSWGLFNEDIRTEAVGRLGRTLYNAVNGFIE